MSQHATGKHGHVEMRCLQSASRAGHASGPDGFEFTASIFSGAGASEAEKAGVDSLGLPVIRVIVFALRICLPNLNHGVIERLAVAIQNADCKHDPLPFHLRACDARNPTLVRCETKMKEGTDGL